MSSIIGGTSGVTFPDGTTQTTAATTPTAVANLSGGSAGKIPFQTGANTTSFTAAGTTGQVLTSAGTGTPTWTTVGGSPWTKIATINGSSMTPYGYFNGLSGYDAYYMVISGLKTASGAADTLYIQFGYGGGTYITSSVAYQDNSANQGSNYIPYSNTASYLPIGASRQLDSTNGKMTAQILFTGMIGGYPSFTCIYAFKDAYSTSGVVGQVGGYLANANSITDLRIFFAQGNALSGTITLYGLTT